VVDTNSDGTYDRLATASDQIQINVNGYCVGYPCDDGNECTVDDCDFNSAYAGTRCSYTNEVDGTSCDAAGLPGFCSSGVCEDLSLWVPPARDIGSVVLAEEAEEDVLVSSGSTFELDFYRNPAYECGLTGNYTFMVVNPANGDAADQAPLWVFLHGGGSGYFDANGDYLAVLGQTEDSWNHEETFDDLHVQQLQTRTVENGQPKDITLTRRLLEGYRVVLVSMCDHDQYSGLGTPYPNNPNPGAEVNGMQATMAAVDYTVANYPTTHVFAHGTSAGSVGAYTLAMSFAAEGTHLTGVVSDSVLSTRQLTLIEIFAGQPGQQYQAGYTYAGFAEKIGFYGQLENQVHPEARIDGGFVEVPLLFVGGIEDPVCMASQPAIPEAVAEGLNNCEWQAESLIQTIAAQADSPHQVSLLDGEGHVPTNRVTPANDIVDTFITDILAANPPHPFAP